jgi:hypothetical protein
MIRTTVIIIFALMLGATPAVGAKLITGKDIRNGSIAERDLDADVRTKIENNGKTGPRGATGATGIQGPTGRPGLEGPQGDSGAAGRDGTNGRDGTPGKDGERGQQGLQGVRGDQGQQGAPGVIASTYTRNGQHVGNGRVTFSCDGNDLILSVIPFDNQDQNALHVRSVELDQSNGAVQFVRDTGGVTSLAGVGVTIICADR